MLHVEDKTLVLPDHRILAYADNGNTSSTHLVLFLHGPLGIGDASHLPRVLLDRRVHFVAPSLPGCGRSSPTTTLAADIIALITHLHPRTHHTLRIYLCAHSFGTVPAQILYSSALAPQLAALVLLAPCSPPHCHPTYARHMSWPAYILLGPPARYIPGLSYLATRLLRLFLAPHLQSPSAAESLLRRLLSPTDPDDESAPLAPWRDSSSSSSSTLSSDARSESHILYTLARNACRSVSSTWHGLTSIPNVYHSPQWCLCTPTQLTHSPPVLIVSSENDHPTLTAMAHWLVGAYKNARIKSIPGGHLSAFLHLDEIWNDVFESETPLL